MLMFVGLGNPGAKYQLNRHNVGFMLMDAIAESEGLSFKSEHKSEVAKLKTASTDILLVKPQTYMNLSGEAVLALQSFYKIPKENLLVAHDEVDLPFSKIRLQYNRGHGGNNGIRNIHKMIGPEYARLRLGVGRPSIPQMDVGDYVLQNFSNEEMQNMGEFLSRGIEAAFVFAEKGFQKAQNQVNAD